MSKQPIGKVDAEYDRELGAIVFKCPKCSKWHPAVSIKPAKDMIHVVLPCVDRKTGVKLTLRRSQFDAFMQSRNLVWTPHGIGEVQKIGG